MYERSCKDEGLIHKSFFSQLHQPTKMIIKGNNPSPFKVNKGTKGYNVWVYKTSTNTNPDGVIRHHYKMLTTHGKYHSREDATAVAWHYIENHSYAHCAA
jgi:hypothetical protein